MSFWAVVPWEDLCADDLVIIAYSRYECNRRLLIWNEAMEKKGLKVNAGKTKVHDLWYRPGPLAEFRQIPMCCLLYSLFCCFTSQVKSYGHCTTVSG